MDKQMNIFDFIENSNPEMQMPPPVNILKQFPGCTSMTEIKDKIPHYIFKARLKPNENIGYFEGVMNGNQVLSVGNAGWEYKPSEILDWREADKRLSLKEWNHFRDNYCSHQNGTIRFDSNGHCSNNKDDSFKKGCTFKDENTAHCWDDWQVCSYDNCPLIKYFERR